MDKTTLVEKDFEDGAILIKELDKAHINVHSALWIYNSEVDYWRLIIASKIADFESPRKAYTHISSAIKRLEKSGVKIGFSLDNISVVSPHHPLVKGLSQALKTEPGEIANIRFSRNRIGNTFIEDAYIYRIQ